MGNILSSGAELPVSHKHNIKMAMGQKAWTTFSPAGLVKGFLLYKTEINTEDLLWNEV